MSGPDLIGLLVTLVTIAVVMCASMLSVVVSVAVPLLVVFVVFRRLSSGDAHFVVSGPLVALASASGAAAAAVTDRGTDNRVKRCSCPACGAPKALPSQSAYVYCDRCGQLMDWDFQAALADKRSRQPGPAYEGLVRHKQPLLQQARGAGDAEAYEGVQRDIFDAYVRACPAACSPRIGDPAYREAFVAWSARSQAAQDLDATCQASFAAQQAATTGLVWDRSNPFAPRIRSDSFFALLEAVLAHQDNVLGLMERDGLLASHPDRPTAEAFRKIGVSVMTQGWLPYLPAGEQPRLLERTGLEDDYIELVPVDMTRGQCAGCDAPLEVIADAQRVVCYACGRMAAVGGGTLPCHGCGATITVPADTTGFACPFCDVALQRMRIAR